MCCASVYEIMCIYAFFFFWPHVAPYQNNNNHTSFIKLELTKCFATSYFNQLFEGLPMISSEVILRDAIASAQMWTHSSCLLSLLAEPVQDVSCSFLWDDMLLTPGPEIETEACLELALSDTSPCGND